MICLGRGSSVFKKQQRPRPRMNEVAKFDALKKFATVLGATGTQYLVARTFNGATKVVYVCFDLETGKAITLLCTRIDPDCEDWQVQKADGHVPASGHVLDAVHTLCVDVAPTHKLVPCTYGNRSLQEALVKMGEDVRASAKIFRLTSTVFQKLEPWFFGHPITWSRDANGKNIVSVAKKGDTRPLVRLCKVPADGLLHLLANSGAPGILTEIRDIGNPADLLDSNPNLEEVNSVTADNFSPEHMGTENILFVKFHSENEKKITPLGFAVTRG